MAVAGVSIVIAAASVVVASTFYSFQLRSQTRVRKADLVMRLLPPDQAEVVLLRVLADLDVDEVAELLDRTSNWVRVTLHRALRRLAERLGEGAL